MRQRKFGARFKRKHLLMRIEYSKILFYIRRFFFVLFSFVLIFCSSFVRDFLISVHQIKYLNCLNANRTQNGQEWKKKRKKIDTMGEGDGEQAGGILGIGANNEI